MKLGQLSVIRDWGWAPEYVDAMWRMLQQDEARDFVIATGKSRRLEEFISLVFGAVNLDWRDHIDIDPNLFRASDIAENYADPQSSSSRTWMERRTWFGRNRQPPRNC